MNDVSQADGEVVNGSRAGILTFFAQTETMPELPGIRVYAESIGCLFDGAVLKNILLPNIFLLSERPDRREGGLLSSGLNVECRRGYRRYNRNRSSLSPGRAPSHTSFQRRSTLDSSLRKPCANSQMHDSAAALPMGANRNPAK